MADQPDEQRTRARREREREVEIDRITAQYAEDYRGGRAPRLEEYLRRYPHYTRELTEFALYFHTVGIDAVAPAEAPAAELSPAARTALTRIRERNEAAAALAASTVSAPAIEGLVKRGVTVGYSPKTLAESVGLTTDLLAKLEARVIAVASIPPTLVTRLADALKVAPGAVATYLGAARPGQAGAFYYADQPPTQQQESFLDAVRASDLSPERKREWAEIITADADAAQ